MAAKNEEGMFKPYLAHTKPYKEGHLLACMRAKNGKVYPYFFEDFKTPYRGKYKITVHAAKVGNFKEHIALTVYAGKYFYTDANDNPQRILKVISLTRSNLDSYSFEVSLNPGEELSLHAYADRTLGNHGKKPKPLTEGAYVKGIDVAGPLNEDLPESYRRVFGDLEFEGRIKKHRRHLKVNSNSKQDLFEIIENFAAKAFAQKLNHEELKPYKDIALQSFESKRDFVSATKVALKAMLCSSRFLQVPIQDESTHSISHVARSLWLSIPKTQQPYMEVKEFETEVRRMLQDPKADRMIESLVNQWLNLKAFDRITPAMSIYPSYSDVLNHYLPKETKLFLAHLIRENLPVKTLIDSDFTFLNQRLAEHYDFGGVYGQDMRKFFITQKFRERGCSPWHLF